MDRREENTKITGQIVLASGRRASAPPEYPPAAMRESSLRWVAAYTSSHHEKRVASCLNERQIESFLPLYSTTHRWKNRCAMKLELPLFPNYVFIRMTHQDRTRVLEVPGVWSLVSFGRSLASLPDFEIAALRSGVGQRKIEPHAYLVVGERVRIKAGAMLGLEGVLVREKSRSRVVIAIEAIRQSVAVEVDAVDLEPAAATPAEKPGCGSVRRPGVIVRTC
jgi:transcription antitermination factor NusG